MATRVTTYDPAKVRVVVAGNTITGYAPGRMVEYRPDAPVWADALGVDNEPIRWQTNNPMAILTLYLAQASPSNFILNTLLNVDRLSAANVAPVLIQDESGTEGPTSIIAKMGWLNVQPALSWAAGPEVRQWGLRLVLPIHDVRGLGADNAVTL